MDQSISGTRNIDLRTEVCGIQFPNPFLLGSGPVTDSAEKILRAFSCGWGGAVLKTVTTDPQAHTNVTPRFAAVRTNGKISGFTNMEVSSAHPLDWWLEVVHKVKREFPDRPILASILWTSSRSAEDWISTARAFTQAGVDGFELNFSCSHAFRSDGGGAAIGKDPEATRMIASWVRSATDLPVFAKLPAMTSYIWEVADAAILGGASGITAINSVPGIAGFDLDTMRPYPAVGGQSSFTGYSGQGIKPIALRCVGELTTRSDVPVFGCGGAWRWEDCVEFLLMGAAAVQLCTAPMFQGFDMIHGLLEGVCGYLEDKGIPRLEELRGRGLQYMVDHGALSREYSIRASVDAARCRGCGICARACRDGAGDAIELRNGKAHVTERCIGCGLCPLTCPAGCITLEQIRRSQQIM